MLKPTLPPAPAPPPTRGSSWNPHLTRDSLAYTAQSTRPAVVAGPLVLGRSPAYPSTMSSRLPHHAKLLLLPLRPRGPRPGHPVPVRTVPGPGTPSLPVCLAASSQAPLGHPFHPGAWSANCTPGWIRGPLGQPRPYAVPSVGRLQRREGPGRPRRLRSLSQPRAPLYSTRHRWQRPIAQCPGQRADFRGPEPFPWNLPRYGGLGGPGSPNRLQLSGLPITMRAHTPALAHTCACTCTHTPALTHTCTHTCTYIPALSHTPAHTHTCPHTHLHIHTCPLTHTCTHTSHTHLHTPLSHLPSLPHMHTRTRPVPLMTTMLELQMEAPLAAQPPRSLVLLQRSTDIGRLALQMLFFEQSSWCNCIHFHPR